jgi:perosamine synthetase
MIPVNTPLLDGNERKYLNECIDSGWISSEGPFVARLEEQFAGMVHRKHGVAVCNGTAAIDAAIEALGIGPGDEVIMPSFTIISCVSQVVRAGGIPVLVDSDPVTWNMDITQVEAKINCNTKAIMAVHIYGLPVDMDPLIELAARYDLLILEDAAEAHGQTYKGRPCGSFGDVSTFSFYPNKHVTTGEGGMVLCNNDILAQDLISLRNLCFEPDRRFIHERLGWNLRMTNMQAAIGVAQLERLAEFVLIKQRMGLRYTEMLSDVQGLTLPVSSTSYADNHYWVYGVLLNDCIEFDAREAISRMAAKGIGCRPFFYPIHLQPVLRKMGLFEQDKHPVAEKLYNRGFYIPSGMALTNDQIDEVVFAIKEVVR